MSLASKFRKGVAWSVIGNIGNNLVSFLVFAIVARLVEPQEIGIIAFAMVFIELGRVFIGAGVPDLIIRQKEWDDAYAMLCFWLNFAGAVFSALVVVFVVSPLASAYFAEGVSSVLDVLAICFILDSVRVVPESKLRRSMNYKSLARRGVSANFLAGAVAIVLALQGWGIWALVVQRLLSSLLTTVFTLYVARWVPHGRAVGDLGATLSHSAGLIGAALMRILADRLPDLLFATFLGPAAVGIYRVGARGFEALVQFAINPVQSASLGAYAANSHQGTLEQSFLRSLAIASLIIFPIFFGAAAVSDEFVELVFGPQWSNSAILMAVLCFSCPALLLGGLLQTALSAQHKTAVIFRLNLIKTVTTLLVLLIGTPTIGLLWTTVALTVRSYLEMLLMAVWIAPGVGVKIADIGKGVFPPLIGSTIVFVAVVFMQERVFTLPILLLGLSAAVGAVIYLLVMLTVFRSFTFWSLGLGNVGLVAAAKRLLKRSNLGH
jgi:O-antigen/teichoic acid export membrane protein